MSEGEGNPNRGDQGIIARLASKNRGLRDQNKALVAKVQELESGQTTLTQQLEQLRAGADPQGLATKVQELQAEIRTRDHRAVFERLATAAGVRPEGLEDLFSLSGYKAEGDVADEKAIGTLIAEQKGKRPFLFVTQGDAKAAEPAPKPGPGGGKGGSSTLGAPVVSQDLVKSDPVYVMKNYDRVVAAAKANVAAGNL